MKTAIIVGAAGGMGKAVAIALAAKGYALALIDCNEKELVALQTQVREIYQQRFQANKISSIPSVLAFPLDITCKDRVNWTVDSIHKSFGHIDLLFSSAGIFALDKNTNYLEQQRLFEVNYFGNLNCVNAALACMRPAKNGQIIVVGSRGALFPRAGTSFYSGSKAALNNTLESLAKSVLSDNVKITVINPAITNTPMASISSIPPEQMIQTDDIAKTVKFLLKLSPGAIINSVALGCGVDLQHIAAAESGSAYGKR